MSGVACRSFRKSVEDLEDSNSVNYRLHGPLPMVSSVPATLLSGRSRTDVLLFLEDTYGTIAPKQLGDLLLSKMSFSQRTSLLLTKVFQACWGRGIRTPTSSFKDCSPTIRRFPSTSVDRLFLHEASEMFAILDGAHQLQNVCLLFFLELLEIFRAHQDLVRVLIEGEHRSTVQADSDVAWFRRFLFCV